MQDLNFQDPDKLFELIDTYDNGTQKNEIDGGNKDVARLLGAMKIKIEEYRENDFKHKFDIAVKTLNDFKTRKGIAQGDVAFFASWLGFMLGMLTAENMRLEFYDDDVLPPFKPFTEEDYEKSYDWE